jgi:uncharacterized protein YbaP (TraB family)
MKKLTPLFLLWLVATGATAQYNSLLWKISGNGLKEPSYLFGTMHTADGRIVSLGDKITAPYFRTAKTYAMELDPNEAMDMSLMSKLMMGSGNSLGQLLPPGDYSFLDSIVNKKTGYPMMLFDNVAPIYIMTILETVGLGLSDSSVDGNSDVLDMYLYNKAKDENKKIIGIETVQEQLNALGALSYKEQAKLLAEEIDSLKQNSSSGKEEVNYYLKQDLDGLNAHDEDAQKPEKFYKALVLDRNARMANRIAGFIHKESTFIAIGALHLPGEKGVIELLRQKGYLVEPVK